MSSDAVLSQMPLVKGNMQGINGRPIKKPFYDHLLSIVGAKGWTSPPSHDSRTLKSEASL